MKHPVDGSRLPFDNLVTFILIDRASTLHRGLVWPHLKLAAMSSLFPDLSVIEISDSVNGAGQPESAAGGVSDGDGGGAEQVVTQIPQAASGQSLFQNTTVFLLQIHTL